MDELTEVRVELARLEKQEQELIGQLYNVRTAVRAQKTKSDELIRRMHAPIDRLPNELLLRIFELAIHASVLAFPLCDVHRHRKRQLAGVSRHWRDLVLQSPTLWTTIRLGPSWSLSCMKAHVARSSQYPLDIEIYCTQDINVTQKFRASVDILIGCAQRWRSLFIQYGVSGSALSVLLKSMECRIFPSLTHVSVEACVLPSIASRFFRFYSERCPHLQHLDLGKNFTLSLDFLIPPSLTSFALAFRHSDEVPSSIFQDVSLQKLTTLSLSGYWGDDLKLHPNSLHLPLLKCFICRVFPAEILIRAIVAHNVTHFTYLPRYSADCDTESICSSFPAVRHVDLDVTVSVFQPGNISDSEYWPNLESLTIHGPASDYEKCLGGLITWLERRQSMQRPKLLIKFTFPDPHFFMNWSILSMLYEALYEHCTLEWGNICSPAHIAFEAELPWVCAFCLIVPLVHQN